MISSLLIPLISLIVSLMLISSGVYLIRVARTVHRSEENLRAEINLNDVYEEIRQTMKEKEDK